MDTIGPLVAGIAALNAVGVFAAGMAQRHLHLRGAPSATPSDASASRLLRSWLRTPRRVASIMPTGAGLVRLMTAELSPATGPVIELGSGTGSVTRAILERGVREDDLALVERDEARMEMLARNFPRAEVLHLDAARLDAVPVLRARSAGAVVSNLPLLAMQAEPVEAILRAAFRRLADDGAFYQFTYGPRCPVPDAVLARLGLTAERVGSTLMNVPPATVYRLQRA